MGPKRGVWLGLSTAIVALSLLSIATATASAARGLSVAKPAPDQLIRGRGKVTVVLRTAPKLRRLEVSLRGRAVRGAFKQVRPGVWRARLRRKWMRPGANVVVATSVGRAGRKDYVNGRFYIGKRRRGYLAVKTRRRVASSAVAKVRMRRLPNLRFRARLNGRNVTRLFRSRFLRRRTAHLGANDGLRFGRNALRVLAARRDGSFDVERRTIFVRRDRPLAVAGPDRRLAGGRPIVLDGRRSRPSLSFSRRGAATASAGFRYRWSVVRRPKGSKARPSAPGGARTRFRPDAIGTFQLKLTATDPTGARGSDFVTLIEARNAPPIGVPVETIHVEGEGGEVPEFSIRVGGETYPLEHRPPGNNKIQAVFLDLETLAPEWAYAYEGTAADAAELKQVIEYRGEGSLVIVSNPADPKSSDAVDVAFKEVVEMLGAKTVPKLDRTPIEPGWSLIGTPGSTEGASVQAGTNESPESCLGGCGNLRGYLPTDLTGERFTYVSGSVVPFDMSAPGAPPGLNRIEVGGVPYDSAPLQCAGSDGAFQVLLLYSETLEELANETFTTNGCNAENEGKEATRMRDLLFGEAADNPGGPVLVFVQGMGTPRPESDLPAWPALETAMEEIGATREVFGTADLSYALVGAGGIPRFPLAEASQSLTGKPAHVSGVLEPNDLGSYVPRLSSQTGDVPFDLAEIAYQQPQPWPYSESSGEKAALTYIAELLHLKPPTTGSSCYVPPRPDVRSEYCRLGYRSKWGGSFLSQLRSADCGKTCRRKHGFSASDWKNVRAELAGDGTANQFSEFEAVEETWKMVKQLEAPFEKSEGTSVLKLETIANEIERALGSPQGEGSAFWLSMLSSIAYVGSYWAGPVEPFVGTLAGGLAIGSLFGTGAGSLQQEEFRVKADEAAEKLSKYLRGGAESIGVVGELIVSDYGKLKAVEEDPVFDGLNSKALNAVTESLETGTKQWIYETLFPAAWEPVSLEGPSMNGRASGFFCQVGFGPPNPFFPFEGAARSAEYQSPLAILVASGSQLPANQAEAYPVTPPDSLFEPIYQSAPSPPLVGPPFAEGGLGLHAPWFWRLAFDFPGGEARAVRC